MTVSNSQCSTRAAYIPRVSPTARGSFLDAKCAQTIELERALERLMDASAMVDLAKQANALDPFAARRAFVQIGKCIDTAHEAICPLKPAFTDTAWLDSALDGLVDASTMVDLAKQAGALDPADAKRVFVRIGRRIDEADAAIEAQLPHSFGC